MFAYAACAWMLVFGAVHLYWGIGGTLGLPPGRSVFDHPLLLAINLIAVPLCLIGALLALALARPWGRRFPRRLLLTAAWSTSALMVVHALPTVAEAVRLGLGARTEELTTEEGFSMFLYEPFWLLGGILWGLAAWRYQRSSSEKRTAR